jgi:hypothetical protein
VRQPDPRDQLVIAKIWTISRGFAGGGESSEDRKTYARQRKNWEVLAINRPHKSQKKETPVVGFSYKDYAGVSLPHTHALVITLQMANHIIHRIFVDNGSLADILYWLAFMHMDISWDKIVPARYPLMGFAGEQVFPVGSIELPVTAGEHPR